MAHKFFQNSRAAVLEEFNKSLLLKEFPLPKEIENGAALLKNEMAGICGTDVHLWRGRLKVPLPIILGHENIGTLVKLGKGIKTDLLGNELKEGDRVIFASSISCGKCYYCSIAMEPTRCLFRKTYGITLSCKNPPYLFGGYAEYIYLLPGISMFKLPEDIPKEAIIAFGCAAPTIVHAIENVGGIEPGDFVAIQGAGPVGLFGVILALESGASRVIVIDKNLKRLQIAKNLGADYLINIEELSEQKDRIEKVMELTDGVGADIVLECSGNPEAFQEGILLCRDSGKYAEIGHYTDKGAIAINPHHITRKQLKIYGSWGMAPRHYSKALKIIERIWKKYRLNEIVSHKFSLKDATKALEMVEEGKVIKALILPHE
ncbi:MAG: zinc-binding dehydrogenase [Candidatus Bathyarchaeia archaeon]